MIDTAGSYRLDRLQDARVEKDRLARQADFAWPLELDFLKESGLAPHARVLDLGCGTGEVTRRLAQALPLGAVVGLDRDPNLLPPSSREGNLRFVPGQAEALPENLGSFDLIYARFLLQHLPHPERAVASAAARLKPGASLTLLDSDEALFLLDPMDPELAELLAAAQALQERLGGDRRIGRRLPTLLGRAGLVPAAYRVAVFTSLDGPFETLFALATGFKAGLLNAGERIGRIGARLAVQAAAGRCFLAAGVCLASGRRPAAA